jgi:hypothetical protein
MKKGVKRFLYIALFLFATGVIAGGGYWYYAFVYCENNRTTPADLDPDFIVNADQLLKDVEQDWVKAGKTGKLPNYILEDGSKIIQTTGAIASKTNEASGNVSINLLNDAVGINCNIDSAAAVQLKSQIEKLNIGDNVTIKGKITGFDFDEEAFEMLGEENKHVKLSECVIITK